MSNYHGRMMNIPTTGRRSVAYREGHRDARHAAAEIASEADAEIASLAAEVAELLDMNSDRNDIEQERDECRNAMNFYAAETKRLTAERDAEREARMRLDAALLDAEVAINALDVTTFGSCRWGEVANIASAIHRALGGSA
jgi:chromosome segregation ATPase